MEYEKNRFINNVYALTAKRGLKIGELESRCGVSIGYFARLRQGKKETAPGADFLLAVAGQLSISVDALLTFDFEAASDSEQLLLSFMEKLIRETRGGSILWQEDPIAYPEATVVRADGTALHPLHLTVPINGEQSQPFYNSRFYPLADQLTPLMVYGSVFPGEKTLYLVQITDKSEEFAPENAAWTELELVMTGPGIVSPIPLCHTDHLRTGRLDAMMEQLFAIVEESVAVPHLTPEAQKLITDFLNDERRTDGENVQA